MNDAIIIGAVLFSLTSAVIIGAFTGELLTVPGTLIGAVYLASGSDLLELYFSDVSDSLQKILSYLMTDPAGPLTGWVHETFPGLSGLLTSYVETFEELSFADYDFSEGTEMAMGILSFFALSAIIYLLAAVWANAELMAVLAVVSAAFSIYRHRKKSRIRRQKEMEAASAQEAEEPEAEKPAVPE